MKKYDPQTEIEIASRVGFLSKSIWLEYFANGSEAWKNRKWADLVNRGHFKKHWSQYAKGIIVPVPKDRLVRLYTGNAVAAPPRLSVLDHDEIVLRSYLNIQKSGVLKIGKFESELKMEDSRLKQRISRDDSQKFPDLFVKLDGPNEDKGIGIEIEISRKEPKRYRQIMMAYMCTRPVKTIIYVTNLQTVKNAVATAIRETYFPAWEKPVGFVSLKDWQKDPLAAKIDFGEYTSSLEQLRTEVKKSAA